MVGQNDVRRRTGETATMASYTYAGRVYKATMRKQATTARFLCVETTFFQALVKEAWGCSTFKDQNFIDSR
uniref:Uncharacterized protein n=1 Tax=Romanomermis culicivorax TaxID=13658 RepID=A0A915HHE5_ROMCU